MTYLLNLLKPDLNWQNFISSFEYMGKGMLGIFIVITILIVGITILNKVTSPKKNKDDVKDDE